MGVELTMFKQVADASASLLELVAVRELIVAEVDSQEFLASLQTILGDVAAMYRVVPDTLGPLIALHTRESFEAHFEAHATQYLADFRAAIHRVRVHADHVQEFYPEFRLLKTVKTSYPPLKRAFARLHDHIDRWVDNDAWLAMAVDVTFKRGAEWLGELQTAWAKDRDDAWVRFRSGLPKLKPYLDIFVEQLPLLEPTRQ